MILLIGVNQVNCNAMGFFPLQPVPIARDTPQQQQAALNSAYAVSQATGDAMKKNLTSDPYWINTVNQKTPAPQPVWPF